MKTCYVKTLLYAYPNLQKIISRIDQLVEKYALNSRNDFTACQEQCEKIIKLTIQKGLVFEIKYYIEKVFSRLFDAEKACIEYKYFKTKQKKDLIGYDLTSRSYFRKQKKLLEYFGECFDWLKLGDEWFDNVCRKIPYIRKLLFTVQTSHLLNTPKDEAQKKEQHSVA